MKQCLWLPRPVSPSSSSGDPNYFGFYTAKHIRQFVELGVLLCSTFVTYMFWRPVTDCNFITLVSNGCWATSVGIVRWSCPAWSNSHRLKVRLWLGFWRNQKTSGWIVVVLILRSLVVYGRHTGAMLSACLLKKDGIGLMLKLELAAIRKWTAG